MPGIFVTATGTDVGKTYMVCGLLRAARRAGIAVGALKPILSGFDAHEASRSDAGLLIDALGEPVTDAAVARLASWRFAAPLSPNMAAGLEGRRLELGPVVAACRATLTEGRLTFIEGIGGVMVPLNDRDTVLDLIAALSLPVLLVSGTALGSLSHCLTADAVLAARGHAPALLVLDESAGSGVPLAATRETLAAFCPHTPIAVVPRDAGDAVFDALLAQVRAIAR